VHGNKLKAGDGTTASSGDSEEEYEEENNQAPAALKRKKPIKKPSKKKSRRDPNAPKPALSAYNIFSTAIRIELKEAQPNLDPMAMSTELGRRWREVSNEDKKQWGEKAAADKERHRKEMEVYTPPVEIAGGGSIGSRPPAKKSRRDPNAPKPALSAYNIFNTAIRIELKEAQPDSNPTVISTELGRRWRELSNEDKKQWGEKAAADAERYRKEMEVYTPPVEIAPAVVAAVGIAPAVVAAVGITSLSGAPAVPTEFQKFFV
jgi:hypothetical protein